MDPEDPCEHAAAHSTTNSTARRQPRMNLVSIRAAVGAVKA
jgi:hypothetical protein